MLQAITHKGTAVQRRNSAPERIDHGIAVENVLDRVSFLGLCGSSFTLLSSYTSCFQTFSCLLSEVIKIFQLCTAIFETVLLQPRSNKVVHRVTVNITLQHCSPVNPILLLPSKPNIATALQWVCRASGARLVWLTLSEFVFSCLGLSLRYLI